MWGSPTNIVSVTDMAGPTNVAGRINMAYLTNMVGTTKSFATVISCHQHPRIPDGSYPTLISLDGGIEAVVTCGEGGYTCHSSGLGQGR